MADLRSMAMLHLRVICPADLGARVVGPEFGPLAAIAVELMRRNGRACAGP